MALSFLQALKKHLSGLELLCFIISEDFATLLQFGAAQAEGPCEATLKLYKQG